jgi:hypothetical protein
LYIACESEEAAEEWHEVSHLYKQIYNSHFLVCLLTEQ